MTPVRTVGGLAHQRTIEGMERDLTKVIEDFDRAINVEALHRIKEVGKQTKEASDRTKEAGKYLLSQCGDSSFSTGSCRARASVQAAQARRDRLQPEAPLYGRHPRISPE